MHFPVAEAVTAAAAAAANVERDSRSILIYFCPYTFVADNCRHVYGIHDGPPVQGECQNPESEL